MSSHIIRNIQKKIRTNTVIQSFFIIIFYVALSVWIIGANPFRGETSAPMDLLLSYPGWSSVADAEYVVHGERSDILDARIPVWVEVKNALINGDSTLWLPDRSGGRTGIQDLSRSILTPSFLMFYLFEDNWLGYYFSSLIKMIIAGVGAFLFLQLYLNRSAALFGGTTFMLIGFHSAWFYWPHVTTSIWIPWLLWSITGWLFYLKARWLSLIVLTTVMLILGGFPAVAAYGLYCSVILSLLLVLTFQKYPLKKSLLSLFLVFICMAIAFMLISIPLFGLAEALSQINLDYRRGGAILNWANDWQLFFDPYLYGSPRVEKTLYGGLVAIVLAALSLVLLLGRKLTCGKERFIALYAVLLFVTSVGISFGLFPDKLIHMIPGVASSGWSRVVVIVGLSIVVLSSVSLGYFVTQASRLKIVNFRIIVYGILWILVTIQILDQVKLFRSFNSIAHKDQFLPVPPSIEFIANNITGLQSVIADNSYMISGTLTSYGIAEWFAHGFRNDLEKKLLGQIVEKPFRTATSALIDGSSINLESGLLDKLGVAYIVGKKRILSSNLIRKQMEKGKMVAVPPLPDNKLSQILNIENPISFSKLGILLATYHMEQAPADVKLQISKGGHILVESVVQASKVKDNQEAIFEFSEPVFLKPGEYEVVISLRESDVIGRVTAWSVQEADNFGDSLLVNGQPVQGSFVYKMYTNNKELDNPLWEIHDLEPNIRVLKNKDVPVGAYYIDDFTADSSWSDSNVLTKFMSSVSIDIDYQGESAGYIVLPMRYYPGWTATIDNKEVEIKKYLGVLPAVYVSGSTKIKYRYNPGWLKMGKGISFLGFFVFVFVISVGRKYEKNS